MVRDFLSGYFSRPPPDPPALFDRDELVSSICRLNRRRVPGPDRIGAAALQHLPASDVEFVLDLFNSSLRLQYFPRLWENANICMIPKPGKPRMLPGSYRPISLLPVLSKVFERLLLARMWPLLDNLFGENSSGSVESTRQLYNSSELSQHCPTPPTRKSLRTLSC